VKFSYIYSTFIIFIYLFDFIYHKKVIHDATPNDTPVVSQKNLLALFL
jgi:hypothetical protein